MNFEGPNISADSKTPEEKKLQDAKNKFGMVLNSFVAQFQDGNISQVFRNFLKSNPTLPQYEIVTTRLSKLSGDYLKDKRLPSDKISDFKARVRHVAEQLGNKTSVEQTETSAVVYDLSKLSEQTRKEISENLDAYMSDDSTSPKELWGGVSRKELLGYLTHNPVAFFAYCVESAKDLLEWQKGKKDTTLGEIGRTEGRIKKYEAIIADLKRNNL
jgi:hypothetical protein